MSTLRLSQIEGSNQTITIPSGHRVVIEGNFQVPLWTTASRPNSPATGFIGYNTEDETFEIYDGTEWAIAGGSRAPDGSSPDKASTSGLQLATGFPVTIIVSIVEIISTTIFYKVNIHLNRLAH